MSAGHKCTSISIYSQTYSPIGTDFHGNSLFQIVVDRKKKIVAGKSHNYLKY
jgi:hypothetical protein